MQKPILIKRCNLEHILVNDKKLYNTNNHYHEEGIERPDDYFIKLKQGYTFNWIDLFHKDNYHKITLDSQDLKWMKEAYLIGCQTQKFSHLYDDELELTCKKYSNKIPKGKWFIRTDYVSLKNGQYGCGPYDDISKIIKSMVSSRIGHDCFHNEDSECNIYFIPWKDINPEKEFRIFVYENNITAISTQHLYSLNEWLNSLSDKQIEDIINKILKFFEENIKDKMSYMKNYVMDLALIERLNSDLQVDLDLVESDYTPYFIEPNSFGRNYAAGSDLFQCVNDHDKLHDSSTIEFRYTAE